MDQIASYARRYYKDADVFCYEHKRFERIVQWLDHNSIELFNAIQDTIMPRVIEKRIGDINFTILLEHGLVCPDRELPKGIEKIAIEIIDKLLKKDGILLL